MKYLIIWLFFISQICIAQPSIEWGKSFGGTDADNGRSIEQTIDGGYIIAGTSLSNDGDVTENFGNNDCWIVKITNNGNIEWEKSMGGSNKDIATSIQQTEDGGYIVAGLSYSNDGDVTENQGDSDYWVVKITNNGNIEWEKAYGGTDKDAAESIQQTEDGGYIVAGLSYSNDGDVSGSHGSSDYWVVKITNNGNIEWEKAYGGTDKDDAESIQQTEDGGYIIVGSSESDDEDVTENQGGSDYWVIKITNNGNIEWEKAYGGTDDDIATSIQQTEDGGYIIVGSSKSDDGDVSGNYWSQDYWVVKITNNGNIEWEKAYGGDNFDVATSIEQTEDGGYIIAGYSLSHVGDITENQGGIDCWVVKITNNGNIEWQKSFGGTNNDYAYSIEQTEDEGYIVAGLSRSNDGDVPGNQGGSDYFIVKFSPEPVGIKNFFANNKLSIYPNPVYDQINIIFDTQMIGSKYIIYDVVGNSVLSGVISEKNTIRNLENLTPGLYLFKTHSRKEILLSRFIKG